jgi:hypothetical protein
LDTLTAAWVARAISEISGYVMPKRQPRWRAWIQLCSSSTRRNNSRFLQARRLGTSLISGCGSRPSALRGAAGTHAAADPAGGS